jgi:hypothetical protein
VRRLLLLSITAFALSACGAATEETKVRDVIVSYHEALADKDSTRFCSYVAPDVLVKLDAAGGCAAVFPQIAAAQGNVSRSPDVASVTIAGDTAVAESTYGYPPIHLQRIAGHWFIALALRG